MTCDSALELLLDAEPGEFSATGATPLGEHLRGCARCRRVAVQLMEDTQRLALAMAAVPVRRRTGRGRHRILAPVLAMATLVVAVLWRARPAELPVVPGSPRAEQAAPLTAASTPVPAAGLAVQPVHASHVRQVRRRAFARAVPLAPVRLEPVAARTHQLSVEASGVTVTPSPGTRATVMHTSNPKLLVVWLY